MTTIGFLFTFKALLQVLQVNVNTTLFIAYFTSIIRSVHIDHVMYALDSVSEFLDA